jgi:molybdopterin-guanine dinucleotide biosynthesis protein A
MLANCYHLLMEARRFREGSPRSRAGFVLTGGRSSRMGRDKAVLPWGDATLVEHIARCVLAATGDGTAFGDVTLVGAPERYAHLGLPTIADRYENCGPLGGLCTALEVTPAEWNLVVACDMPGVTVEFLSALFDAAEASGADCLVPEANGWHPLCAVYRARARSAAKRQLLGKSLKMHDFLARLRVVAWPSADVFVQNVNTPQDWTSR